jgi:hypothetical protein
MSSEWIRSSVQCSYHIRSIISLLHSHYITNNTAVWKCPKIVLKPRVQLPVKTMFELTDSPSKN